MHLPRFRAVSGRRQFPQKTSELLRSKGLAGAAPPPASRVQNPRCMKTLLLELLVAQSTLMHQPPESPLRRATLMRLVNKVPAPVLAHFLRLVEHDRIGVAYARHGVCSGCHLRIPSGQTFALRNSDDLHLCENCGAYLLLADDEIATPAAAPKPAAAPRRGRPRVCEAVPA